MEIDLGAEELLGAERQGREIAVEIKSFLSSSSAITEFHRALGQFINYRTALKLVEPERALYLAVPDAAYSTFFQLDFPKSVVKENQVRLVVYDVESQEIVLWET